MAVPASRSLSPHPMDTPSPHRPSRPGPSPTSPPPSTPSMPPTAGCHPSSPSSLPSAPSSEAVSPTSPSHTHPPALPPSSSLERYWPLIAVTICSIYLISVLPFVAPGMFLLQFSLLRYIRHQSEKQQPERLSSSSPPFRPSSRRARSRRPHPPPPVMESIVEEELCETEGAEEGLVKAASVHGPVNPPSPLPLQSHRPPPLVIPRYNAGVITAPLLLSSSASSPSTLLIAPPTLSVPVSFALATPSRSWADESLDLNESLQSLLHSSMLSLERSSSDGHQNLLAAAAALFAPSIFQSLASPSLVASSRPPSPAALSPTSPRCPPVAGRGAGRRSPFSFMMRELPLSPFPSALVQEVARVEGERVEEWNAYALEGVACAV